MQTKLVFWRKIMTHVPVFYSDDYVLSRYAFDTTRKSKLITDSLVTNPIAGIDVRVPTPLTEKQLEEVHDSTYIRAVRTGTPKELAESQGFAWDAGFFAMVSSSNGGAVAAALASLQGGTAGSLSSGLHHARHKRGDGFCTFNGLVLAAKAALRAGANSVLILDLDAHCGGGTHSLIEQDSRIWQIDVATSSFDEYVPSVQTTLDILYSAKDYLPTVTKRLTEIVHRGPAFDLCIYNAGMDPYEGCDVGGLAGITMEILAAREHLVFDWARKQGMNLAFVVAGGYTGARLSWNELVRLHRMTLQAAVR